MATIGHTMPQPMTTISHLLYMPTTLCSLVMFLKPRGVSGNRIFDEDQSTRRIRGENRSRSVNYPVAFSTPPIPPAGSRAKAWVRLTDLTGVECPSA